MVAASGTYTLRDPWIIVSITLYIVALGIVFLYAVPALRKAARMIEGGVLAQPEPEPESEVAKLVALTTTATEMRAKEALDALSGRLTGAGALVLLVFAVITVIMTVRPF